MKLDPDEIRSSNSDDFFNEEQTSSLTPLSIFFAVLAAILVAWFLRTVYIDFQLRRAAEIFSQQMLVTSKQTQKSLQQMQLRNQQRIEANKNALEEKVLEKKMTKYRAEQQKQALITASITERRRKIEAWENFYKPVIGCEASNDNKDLMKCGNDHAKAKKKFEALWANKKIR
ncbi:MAG: hypothetical protein ACKE5M_06145 [Methylophilaceae bacterium]